MDNYLYCYMYNAWIQKYNDKIMEMKKFGCFVGGFYNPEMARKIQNEESNVKNRTLDESEMQKSMQYIEDYGNERDKIKKQYNKRKKRNNN